MIYKCYNTYYESVTRLLGADRMEDSNFLETNLGGCRCVWLSFMYFELYLCLVRHLCAMHARQSLCKVEG
jgi:hypothetical protein